MKNCYWNSKTNRNIKRIKSTCIKFGYDKDIRILERLQKVYSIEILNNLQNWIVSYYPFQEMQNWILKEIVTSIVIHRLMYRIKGRDAEKNENIFENAEAFCLPINYL